MIYKYIKSLTSDWQELSREDNYHIVLKLLQPSLQFMTVVLQMYSTFKNLIPYSIYLPPLRILVIIDNIK
jgi:hypothetical protein